jgi:hypothetical protein
VRRNYCWDRVAHEMEALYFGTLPSLQGGACLRHQDIG